MFIKLTKKVVALTLALMFASVFLLAACGEGTGTDKNYTVTFDTGVAEIVIAPVTGKAGAPVTLPADPERDGFVFAGWTYNGQSYALSVIPARNITLTAKWNQFFTITFNSSGGSPVEPIVAAETERITAPPDPVRENFKFNGWYNGEEKFFFTAMPHGNLTLTAKWLGTVTITFDADADGITVPPITEVPGTVISAPKSPVREGLFLDGWWLDGVRYTFTVMPETNITLKAKWAEGTTISFVTLVDGLTVEPLTGIPGTAVKAPPEPERAGYALDGWLLNGEKYKFSTFPQESITLTANWAQGTTITFVTGVPGLEVPALVAIPGKPITAPEILRAGYHLDCWQNGGKIFTFNVMPSINITLTARWAEATKLPAVCVTMRQADGTLIALPSSGRTPGDDQKRYQGATVSVLGSENGTEAGSAGSVEAGFRARGYGSLFYGGAKKPYRLRFEDKQSLLGMPKSRHWVLISSHRNFLDNTMLIANTALALADEVFDAFEYVPKSRLVDLFINNEYRGVYVLTEKYRVESGKVDIESQYNSELAAAGKPLNDTGYMLSLRWNWRGPGWARFKPTDLNGDQIGRSPSGGTTYDMCVESPDYEGTTQNAFTPQVNFIKGEVTKLCDAMRKKDFAKFSELADVASFVDLLIFWELYRNGDVAGGGYYMYKKPGGKFYAGTPWDFDNTFNGNATDGLYGAVGTTGGNANPFITYPWAMDEFKALVRARWKILSPQVKAKVPELWNPYINDADIQTAIMKNFTYWRNAPSTSNENYNGAPSNGQTWLNNANGKRNWLVNRAGRLDALFA